MIEELIPRNDHSIEVEYELTDEELELAKIDCMKYLSSFVNEGEVIYGYAGMLDNKPVAINAVVSYKDKLFLILFIDFCESKRQKYLITECISESLIDLVDTMKNEYIKVLYKHADISVVELNSKYVMN